ncbi:aromatic acid/H+ symport family MFS transporter [Methylobacterium nodulans]|uniref:Major facilitator superfamily MFS_1 n=1 Tax=Methylobacterium nodulans (strain LMG 21967 / CNCM I-2342 / ORS 2060) TaxID=460265 RepID=B8IWB9_METNO|nr:aromatic acid/H+ symport family MFS transporter [Methylobacterium nodulans]ACL62709.1 major facilitator superfamily MFS_1 [Methylobacterium nodulans ORS 2060]
MNVTTERIDVQNVIDGNPISRLQMRVILLCFLVVFLDGYDTAVIGFVAPALAKAWSVPPPALKPLLSAALFGLAAGALAAGPLADRIGRKVVLVISVALFGGLTLLSAFATDLTQLTILRFLTGLGLGAAMPNATTLTAEYCPARHRSFLVTVMFCGFTLGSAGGGFLGGFLIPAYGWQSAFWVGGLAPLALAAALITLLPESVQFLVVRRGGGMRVAGILRRLAPGRAVTGDAVFVTPDLGAAQARSSLGSLFQNGLAAGTACLWLTYFMGLLVIFLLRSWLPTLVTGAGLSLERAAMLGGAFELGGTVGALLVAWCMDRFGAHRAIALSYLLGAVTVCVVAYLVAAPLLLAPAIFMAGFFLSGSQTSLSPLAAAFYPTHARATGVAWMLGMGRFGGILGALSGGVLLGLGWDFQAILTALAVPALGAAAAIWFKGRWRGREIGGGQQTAGLQLGHG